MQQPERPKRETELRTFSKVPYLSVIFQWKEPKVMYYLHLNRNLRSFCNGRVLIICPYTVFISPFFIQVAYYGEPSMAPALFLKAYLESTTEEYRLSEDAPKIDAKNPAGWLPDFSSKYHQLFK